MLSPLKRTASFLPSKVVIVASKRTPIGSFMGSLSPYNAVYLSVQAIQSAILDSLLNPNQITEVMIGQSLPAASGQSPTRQSALSSDLLPSTLCINISKHSSSGLKSITLACQGISLSHSDIVIAGGMESMSQSPFILPNTRLSNLIGDGDLHDGMLKDSLLCSFNNTLIGKCVEETALRYNITREEQDNFSAESYKRAHSAWTRGFFAQEVLKFELFSKALDKKFLREDEEFRKVEIDKLCTLKPVFQKDGTITAGNSAKFADGASVSILMQETRAKRLGIKPIARVLAFADAETDPLHFAESPKEAVNLALARAGVRKEEVDLFEIHESFSVVPLANMKILKLDHEKVNVNGGALAIGDPVGMSGARIVGTLIYALKEKNKRLGVAVVANGGGGSTAIVIEAM